MTNGRLSESEALINPSKEVLHVSSIGCSKLGHGSVGVAFDSTYFLSTQEHIKYYRFNYISRQQS
jgi:hypothetical protein